MNKVNFHRYIDSHKNILVVVKTVYGKLIAGFSTSAISVNGTERGDGLLIPLWNQ
jgi:hypothetical protein